MNKENTKELVIKAARIIDDKKAEDIKVYDLMGLSSLCDYVIVATAAATPHLEAIEQEASTQLKEDGIYKSNRDGGQTGSWRVSDYGGFMLHIMTQASRDFYALDKIFSFGKELNWQKPSEKPVKKAAAKKVAAKKTIAKKTTVKKTVKKAADKKVTLKKSVAKKTVKKVAVKKTAVKKVVKPIKKTAPKAAKKTTVKKVVKKAIKKVAKTSSKKGTK